MPTFFAILGVTYLHTTTEFSTEDQKPLRIDVARIFDWGKKIKNHMQ